MSLLAAMMGGALPPLNIPCAYCLADLNGNPAPADAPPLNASTLVAGTLVCAEHVSHAVSGLDRGHVARAVEVGLADVVVMLDRLPRQ